MCARACVCVCAHASACGLSSEQCERRTDTRRQRVIPGSPLAGHALQRGGPVQCVSGLAPVRDAAAGEVALVVYLEAKLWHAGVLAVGQLETW